MPTASALPVLVTKLRIPPRRARWMPRLNLLERLVLRPQTALGLVTAPAGFGKTTLLSEWCDQLTRQGTAVGWVTLDEGDNDPVRFFRYLVAALSQALGETAQLAHTLELLESMPAAGWEQSLSYLINQLESSGQECLLLLDDYHRVTAPAVHSSVAYLLEHRPLNFHIALGSRAIPPLPISRLRARGQLIELRASDLRFSEAEAVSYLVQSAEVEIDPAQAAHLAQPIEGWAAGLQLAVLSLQGRSDLPGYIAAFSGQQRAITSYLIDEVFSLQPPAIQSFLLQTAPLEQMNASLCAAVLADISPAECQALLETLEQHNLFTMPLDDEGGWFRYHHLFGAALLSRLKRVHPDWLPALHRRASAWFEAQGMLSEAVRHALAAPDPKMAARLLDQCAEGLLAQGETAGLMGWLDALPPEQLNAHPGLQVARAWALAMQGEVDLLAAHMQVIEAGSQEWDAPLRGKLAAVQAFLSLNQRNPAPTIQLSETALQLLPPEALFWRGIAVRILGEACLWTGDLDLAARYLSQSIQNSLAVGNLSLGLSSISQLAGLQAAQGHLHRAMQTYQEALKQAAARGWKHHPYTGLLHAGIGLLLLEWDQLELAEEHLGTALNLGNQGNIKAVALTVLPSLARLALARRDFQAVSQYLDEVESILGIPPEAKQFSPFAGVRARFLVLAGDLDAVQELPLASNIHFDDPVVQGREPDYLTLAMYLVAHARKHPGSPWLAQAMQLLDRLAQLTQAPGLYAQQIEVRAVQAQALAAGGDLPSAMLSIEQALNLAEPEGYLGIFLDQGEPLQRLLVDFRLWAEKRVASPSAVASTRLLDYADRILESFARRPLSPDTTPSALEPLSRREREVLHLAALGASNQEIAKKLFISLATVKSHLNHIMRKLAAQNRTEAVAKARRSGWL